VPAQHTVVLLLMHNKAGSMGLIINRLLGPATPEDVCPGLITRSYRTTMCRRMREPTYL